MTPLGPSFFPRIGGGTTTTQPGDFRRFTLEINEEFDPDNPVLKNGTKLTGKALESWNGIKYLLDDYVAKKYLVLPGLESRAKRQDLYYYGRELGEVHAELMIVLRLTGWNRCLDLAVQIMDWQLGTLIDTPFTDLGSSIRLPVHAYRRWPWTFSTSAAYYGNDNHQQDNSRTHAPLWQLAYALKTNIGKTSEAGYNYQSKYNTLIDYLEDWIKAWSGPEQDLGITKSGSSWVPASNWSPTYKGSLHGYYTGANDATAYRAGVNGQPNYPIMSRHHVHSHIGASLSTYFMGKTLPQHSAAAEIGRHGFEELFLKRNCYMFTPPPSHGSPYEGYHMVWPRACYFTGHYDTSHTNHQNYAQPIKYASYVAMDSFNMWLDGQIPSMPEFMGEPLAKTMNHYVLTDTPYSGDMAPDLLNALTLPAASNYYGQTIPFKSAIGGDGWNTTSYGWQAISHLHLYMIWDTDDDHWETYMGEELQRSALSEDGAGYDAPYVLTPNIGRMLKYAGAADWHLEE